MDRSTDGIAEVVREVLTGEPRVIAAYLFGSVARGTAGPLSDVDVGVVCAGGVDARALLDGLVDRLVLALGTEKLDLIDLTTAPVPLRYRAVREGRRLVCTDARARERFEVDTIRRYLDFQPLRRRAFDVARAAILRAV